MARIILIVCVVYLLFIAFNADNITNDYVLTPLGLSLIGLLMTGFKRTKSVGEVIFIGGIAAAGIAFIGVKGEEQITIIAKILAVVIVILGIIWLRDNFRRRAQ